MHPTLACALAVTAALWPGVEPDSPAVQPSRDRQLAAIVRLGSRGDSEALRVIRPFLDDLDASVRLAAARALVRAGDPDTQASVTASASDPRASTRLAALTVLREAGTLPVAGRRAAERALTDQDAANRIAGLDVLRAHPAVESAPIVAGSLGDGNRDVRIAAIRLLGLSGDTRAILPLLERIDGPDRIERVVIIDALGSLGGRADYSAGPALMRQLADPDDSVRAAAIYALGRLRWAPAVPSLRALAGGRVRNLLVRRSALALGSIGDPGAIAALVDLLREPVPSEEVVEALKRAGPGAVKPVAGIVLNAFPTSAVAATTILAALGDRRATLPLVAVLKARPSVAGAAARALGSLRDRDAVPALMLAAAHPRYASAPSIREACLEALASIRDARASRLVASSSSDRDPYVRVAGLHLATALGEGLPTEILRARLADADPSVRRAATEAAAVHPSFGPIGRGWVRVRLLNPDGEPASGRRIRFRAGASVVWTKTDDRGEAEASGLPRGPYGVTVDGIWSGSFELLRTRMGDSYDGHGLILDK